MDQHASRAMDAWEAFKPILANLWLTEKWELERIVREMRTYHNFHRVERQYKHQFSIWGWSKNVRKADIAKAIKHCKSRVAAGKASSQVIAKGKRVDNQKIRRALKEEIRTIAESIVLVRNHVTALDHDVLPFTNSFFLKWNLPYAAMRHSYVRTFDYQSTFDPVTPYSDIEVKTPSATASPNAAPSPTTQVTKHLILVDRARMFARGQHEQLLKLLNGDERRLLSDWLYQYWFFCFKTAKHWGKGPMNWTAQLLRFDEYKSTTLPFLPGTPHEMAYPGAPQGVDELTPSHLCRWYIHVREQEYEALLGDVEEPSAFTQHNPDDDSTWPRWLASEQKTPLQSRLRDALEHNDFSPTPILSLPIAIPQIAQAAETERSNELLLESLGFSIMSRNIDQINTIFNQVHKMNISIGSLHPFHLATSFLDGSKSCCNVFLTLAAHITGSQVHEMYINEHGHTVLDNLWITIVKSHTSASPGVVDNDFRNFTRFLGEEVDICGRWDADSASVRQLYARGSPSIPSSWKHKFCNTSVQTIYHCIHIMLGQMPTRLVLETPSGLYLRRCFDPECGKKLQLSSLHALVMVAYQLAINGKDDEDLFGVLACALCLISGGFDPSKKAEVSVTALLSLPPLIECDHEELTAADLAENIMVMTPFQDWDPRIKTGWAVLTGVLRRCEVAHIQGQSEDGQSEDGQSDEGYAERQTDANTFMGCTEPRRELFFNHAEDFEPPLCFVVQKRLGMLWSSVQAEVLSYRRLEHGAPWTSPNFSMATLQEQLEKGEELTVGYVAHNLLKAHCACHSYGTYMPPLLDDAIDPDLANLDVWNRATYGVLIEP